MANEQKQYLVDYDETIGVKCWNVGCGPMCCPKHHIPMTIYGGCKECNKEFISYGKSGKSNTTGS